MNLAEVAEHGVDFPRAVNNLANAIVEWRREHGYEAPVIGDLRELLDEAAPLVDTRAEWQDAFAIGSALVNGEAHPHRAPGRTALRRLADEGSTDAIIEALEHGATVEAFAEIAERERPTYEAAILRMRSGDVAAKTVDALERAVRAAGKQRHLSAVPSAPAEIDAKKRVALPKTDLGNAERLVLDHEADLRFVPGAGFHVWEGKRWRPDDDGEVVRRAKDTVRRTRVESASLDDSGDRDALWKWANTSETAARIDSMVKLARSDSTVIARAEVLDRESFLLNVENGTIDLRTGNMREHRRGDLLTKYAPVVFDPDANCPTWTAFLETVFDGDRSLIDFTQKAVGYTLTGDTREQCLFFMHGEGGNGKTTFLNVVRALLGDYAEIAPSGSILAKRPDAIPNDLAALRGARLVTTSETREGAKLDEVLVKDATGGDPLRVRFLHREWFTYQPAFKLWVAGNHRPRIRGGDDGIWDRIRLVPCIVRIRGSALEDKTMQRRLFAELPGVLAWAIEGCLRWQRDGLGTPPKVSDATRAYREAQDTYTLFIESRCLRDAGAVTPFSTLRAAYAEFCRENDLEAIDGIVLAQRLDGDGFASKRAGHGGQRVREGIRLG